MMTRPTTEGSRLNADEALEGDLCSVDNCGREGEMLTRHLLAQMVTSFLSHQRATFYDDMLRSVVFGP